MNSVEAFLKQRKDERDTKLLREQAEDAALDLRELLESEDKAAIRLLGLQHTELNLFEKPGLKVFICEKGIVIEGEKSRFKDYAIYLDDTDDLYIIAVIAARAQYGGVFKGQEPSICIEKIRQAIDKIAAEIEGKLERKELDRDGSFEHSLPSSQLLLASASS